MTQTKSKEVVYVNHGNVLESKLNEWKGGSRHPYGIAEYINNSDDSYRRLGKFSDQDIFVEIQTRTAKRINKLIIRDTAEGMSYEDLENKFFQYFDSYSGRKAGAKVRGQFGTGGKAYAIMNFRNCWIESVKDGMKSKAKFYWDHNRKQIMKEYGNGGFVNQQVKEPDGTTVTLEEALKVNTNPEGFVDYLEKLPGLRHVLKGQKVHYIVKKKSVTTTTDLIYRTPDSEQILKSYKFKLPEGLRNNESSNEFQINYFEQPIGNDAFIDISDGISSVEDMEVSKIDGRPFSKYINGNIIIDKLQGSTAIKENRRGLEDGDDLTEEIIEFLNSCVTIVINEIEKEQKEKDKLKRLEEANKKLDELSKFLSKRDLKFMLDLKELKKRFSTEEIDDTDEDKTQDGNPDQYRKPTESDPDEDLVKGRWVVIEDNGLSDNINPTSDTEFIPEENGPDAAVKVGKKRSKKEKKDSKKRGIQVLFSNDPNNPKSPSYTEYDEPVSDRDLHSNGIIWINSNHPIVAKNLNTDDKIRLIIRDENIANYVLMMIAQYYALKEMELQPENEATDFMLSYRKHFFELQSALRIDDEVQFFDKPE